MSDKIFILTYFAVSVTIFLLCLLIDFYRKTRHLKVFALAFASFALSSMLLVNQTQSNLFYSSVISNFFLTLGSLLIFAGTRIFYKAPKLFPKRFWLYLLSILIVSTHTSLIQYNYHLRAVFLSGILIIILADFYLFLQPLFTKMSKIIRLIFSISIFVNIGFYIIRIFLILTFIPKNGLAILNIPINSYVFLTQTITLFLWFVIIIFLDDSKLMDEIKSNEEKYKLIANSASDIIWVYNTPLNRFTFISPNVSKILGYDVEECSFMNMADFLTDSVYLQIKDAIEESLNILQANPDCSINKIRDTQHLHKNGTLVWMSTSVSYRKNVNHEVEIIGVSRNIEERKKKEAEISHLSSHDMQTGLENRNSLRMLMETQATELNGHQSALFIDIDNFRLVNDALGHEAGDRMLVELADKVKECVNIKGSVYRFGGDEFVAVINSTDLSEIYEIAEDIKKSISRQININNRLFFLTASIGICIGNSSETILEAIENADTALYISKKSKNTITLYNPSMNRARTREAILESDMPIALKNGQFQLYYQPIIDINSKSITQAEALLRWNHPEFGLVSPAEFIPIAENTKLIIPISNWVIKEACLKIKHWEAMGMDMSLSINLSLMCFENRISQLLEYIIETVTESEINPRKLQLEITESILMDNHNELLKVFQHLKDFGIQLALDDFGTGYSSFGYMKDIPLNTMKLDRSLISSIDKDEKAQLIVKSLITIIHGLDLIVVAEGVETIEQLQILNEYNCDRVQGFFFSKPKPENEFLEYYNSKDFQF